MENTKIFAGYVKSVKVWNDAARSYVDPDAGVAVRFSLSIAEMNDLQRYATAGEKPFVSFDLKLSSKGKYYIEVSDPSTWSKQAPRTVTPATPEQAFGGPAATQYQPTFQPVAQAPVGHAPAITPTDDLPF